MLLVASCSRDRTSDRRVIATRPDSEGWRFVSLPNAGLALRYPARRVRGVDNRWQPQCDSLPHVSLLAPVDENEGVLVVSSMPDSFPVIARHLGFSPEDRGPGVVCVGDGCGRREWVMRDTSEWFTDSYADTMHVGGWRGLSIVAEMRGYFDDDPADTARSNDTTEVRHPPATRYQYRFFAAASRSNRCAVVLSFVSTPLRDVRGGADSVAWDGATIRHLLSEARIGR